MIDEFTALVTFLPSLFAVIIGILFTFIYNKKFLRDEFLFKKKVKNYESILRFINDSLSSINLVILALDYKNKESAKNYLKELEIRSKSPKEFLPFISLFKPHHKLIDEFNQWGYNLRFSTVEINNLIKKDKLDEAKKKCEELKKNTIHCMAYIGDTAGRDLDI